MFDRSSTFGDALDNPAARAVLETLPARHRRLAHGDAVPRRAAGPARGALADAARGRRGAGAALGRRSPRSGDGADGRAAATRPRSTPDPDYEGDDVAARLGSGHRCPAPVPRWGVVEVRFDGPSHGNPFVDVELDAVVHARRASGSSRRVLRRRRRLRHPVPRRRRGRVALRHARRPRGRSTASRARSTVGAAAPERTGRSGSTASTSRTPTAPATARSARPPTPGRTSPTSCRSRRSRRSPTRRSTRCGCASSRSRTSTTRTSPSASRLPGSLADGFDLERFDPAFFRRLEKRIAQLGALGIEADLILFHAYDRWGFADLGPAVDDRLPALRRAPARRIRERLVVAGERVRPRCGRRTGDDWERFAAHRRRGGPVRAPRLDPQLPRVLRLRPAVDHARERPAGRRVPHRGEHRRVAGRVGQAGRHRRVRLRGRHRPGLGQHHGRGDGAPLLGGRGARRLRRPRRDLPATTARSCWWSKGGELVRLEPRRASASSTASRRGAGRRARSAALRLGRAVGRRRRPAPDRLLRVQPAAASATSCSPRASGPST